MSYRFPQLSVSNFGPIQEAEITLRPLTVFIGPSNTGKSYLASLIYALHNYFTSLHSHTIPSEAPGALYSIFQYDHSDATRRLSQSLSEIGQQINILNGEPDSKSSGEVVIPEYLDTFVRSIFCKKFRYQVEDHIIRCFGTEIVKLRRRGAEGSSSATIHTMPLGMTRRLSITYLLNLMERCLRLLFQKRCN